MKAKQVRRELLPAQSTALLRELHLLTREGHLNADALRKLKQVNHLVGLITPALEDVQERVAEPVLADLGSGSAYLGFVIYELFLKAWGKGALLNVETRADLVTRAKERAAKLGFDRMQFAQAAADQATYPEKLDMVVALHACDTATDDALQVAIQKGADHVAVVPCCQAEVAQQLKGTKDKGALAELHSHPWHRREFGSHLTNVIRALTLESFGYAVTVTELTGWEHSLKNELILGRKVQKTNPLARARLDALLRETGVQPKLIRGLGLVPAGMAVEQAAAAVTG